MFRKMTFLHEYGFIIHFELKFLPWNMQVLILISITHKKLGSMTNNTAY